MLPKLRIKVQDTDIIQSNLTFIDNAFFYNMDKTIKIQHILPSFINFEF